MVEAGRLASESPGRHSVAGRMGRRSKPPPQLGQTLCRTFSTQSAQNVHSYVQMRAKVDAPNRQGETALIVAVQARNTQVVRRLLQAGADPDRADSSAGMSARDYAKRDNRVREILTVIERVRPTKR